MVKLNRITSANEITQCPISNIQTEITANFLSDATSSISTTYIWQYREGAGNWKDVTAYNTETRCKISDIYNDTYSQKIFYFRRRVNYSQSARWGVGSKNYIDESAVVKVIVPALVKTNPMVSVK